VAGQTVNYFCPILKGATFEMDFFNTGQKLLQGQIPVEDFLQLLQQHKFAVIQMNTGHPPMSYRLPQAINARFLDNYEIALSTHWVFLVPRRR